MKDRKKEKLLKLKLSEVLPLLNEKQRRVVAAAEARVYGWGGTQAVARVTGMSPMTIRRGLTDLEIGNDSERIRKPGGGRKKISDTNPALIRVLESLVDPVTRGDSESALRWTCKSVRKLEDALQDRGYDVSYRTVARLLNDLEYRLQTNRKTSEGTKDHPDRDEQFHYINDSANEFLRKKQPVISVDTKKKELVGHYNNPGRAWDKKGNPVEVLSPDVPDPDVPKTVPYGVYVLGMNTGWVNVGIDADTAEFAVESIRQW